MFQTEKNRTDPGQIANFNERLEYKTLYDRATRVIALNGSEYDPLNPNKTPHHVLDPLEAMKLKKAAATNDESVAELIIDNRNELDQYDHLGRPITPSKNGVLDGEEAFLLQKVSEKVAEKTLEMYFDAYMSPIYSDCKWRLGPTVGVFMKSTADEGGGTDDDGMYTRAVFSADIPIRFWNGEAGVGISNKSNYYASLMFPPYKIGKLNKIGEDSDEMSSKKWTKQAPSFNQDTFKLQNNHTITEASESKGEVEVPVGFTYRDPGFKPINDNIMFLQFLTEKVTGIVSTYLTEWDLSLYMQENMLQMEANGGVSKLWLNYRIRQDNPLATSEEGYDEDRALVFNVMGSAVSKIDFDCTKVWRPSDYPLSAYWLPYQKNIDWTICNYSVWDDTIEQYIKIPYPSFHNEPALFSYKGKTLKAALKHDDYMRMGLSGWKGIDMLYYMALYYIESDSLSDADILTNNLMQKILGAEPGMASKLKRDVGELKRQMKMDLIDSGGSSGAQGAAGMGGSGGTGSKMANKTRRFCNPFSGGGNPGGIDENTALAQMNQAIKGTKGGGEFDPPAGPEAVIADVAGKPDASSMGNYTGLNRFSPALYGGPHGSNYSPFSVQGYFEPENRFFRNSPRISSDDANEFTSTQFKQLFEGNNSFYDNGNKQGFSFSKSLSILKSGVLNWIIGQANVYESVTKLIKGTITYRTRGYRGCIQYNFPQAMDGMPVQYYGPYQFQSVTSFQPGTLWHLGYWAGGVWVNPNWWNSYYSYYNDYAIRVPMKRNNIWGYDTTIYEIYRMGTYSRWTVRSYRKYAIHDEPNVKWKITGQMFLTYDVDNRWNGSYWGFIRKLADVANIRKKFPVIITRHQGFKLSFENEGDERRVREHMVLMGRGIRANANLIFLEGNESQRYKFGPESMFIANVRVEEYLTLHKKPFYEFRQQGWWFIRQIVYRDEYVYLPYLMVDMNHTMDWFSDKTNTLPYTNKHLGNSETPLQLIRPTRQDKITPTDDILKKFKQQYSDRFISWKIDGPKIEAKERFFGVFIDLVNGVEVAKLANGKNEALRVRGRPLSEAKTWLPRRPEYYRYNLYGDQESTGQALLDYIAITNLGPGQQKYYPFIIMKTGEYPVRHRAPRDMHTSGNVGLLNPLYYTGAPIGERVINWVTYGTVGISGIGILGKIQGADVGAVDSPFENFSDYVNLPISALGDTKLYSLPFKVHKMIKANAEYKNTEEGLPYYIPGGFPEYVAEDMDLGLKRAIANMSTRASFYKVEEYSSPYLIGIDVPFRALLNICLEQASYFLLLKKILMETIDFDILRKMLGEFVDKSVQKANGLAKGEVIDSDPMHPLYNYFLARMIELLGDPLLLEDARERIVAEFDAKATKFNWAIQTLSKPCERIAIEWTWREILEAYDVAREMEKEKQMGLVEEFIFGYLNLLYEYRKFFICKRFNKQDGTMWVMRQLEAILNYMAPAGSQDNPPPSPAMLAEQSPSYKVAFYEIQNRTSDKIDAFVNNGELDEDRTTTVYVKVNWVGVKAYNNWVAFYNDPMNNPEAPEVARIEHEGRIKYAIKPKDGVYTLLSKELLDNDANIKYNALHPQADQRKVLDIDRAMWYITWGNENTLTPIRWNVFVNIDPDAVLEYSDAAITPEEFICLVETGADFWTVRIPKNLWPRSVGYRTKIKLKKYELEIKSRELKNDPYLTALGNQGYMLWPIADQQRRPVPGIDGEVEAIKKQLEVG